MSSDNIVKEIPTKLFNILLREHERLGHAGAQPFLRDHHYWPLPGKNLWKLFIREWSICFRNKPKIVEQLMRNLPKSQITPCPPFYNIGINYADSIWIRDKTSRVFKQIKCYVYVCICFSIWPIHIETVTQLTSEVFNGSNDIGAAKEINYLFEMLCCPLAFYASALLILGVFGRQLLKEWKSIWRK